MKINDKYELNYDTNTNTTTFLMDGKPFGNYEVETLNELYKRMILAPARGEEKEIILEDFFNNSNTVVEKKKEIPLATAIQKLMDFFTEFNFTPSFRFLNTLVHVKKKDCPQYITNYFSLMGSPYAEDVAAKVKSKEFKKIMLAFKDVEPTHTINNRFRVYYGAQGTGKTTKALEETANLCMVCNSSMLPSDLLEDFTFDDGKAAFHPSALVECMENGKAITMDEINLLPFDSLRFLQGIFDGKTEFQYKGHTIHIKDGFKVIGTMNLTVNGVVFGLPEPLVDRCESITEFVLTPEMLMGAF